MGGVCTIDCAGDGRCDGRDIVCPDEYACALVCDGEDACDTGSLQCPDAYACSLTCRGGNDACGDFALRCGDGSCNINCADDTCSGANVMCGAGACTASCEGMPAPDMHNVTTSCDANGC